MAELVRVTVPVELRRAQILSETRSRVRSLARSLLQVRSIMRRTARRFHVESYRVFVDPGGFLAVGYYLETRRYSRARDRAEPNVVLSTESRRVAPSFNHPCRRTIRPEQKRKVYKFRNERNIYARDSFPLLDKSLIVIF